jgi:osmoprotectant transport system permease protein
LQTIPSLALLAFLIPFLGIGMKPAALAIGLYCLLPIVQNTLIGLENLPSEMKEAALALGFNFWQKLWFVELPLALPVIIAGIRIAVVMAVGMATLAALIGAGGFGDYITQGLALNDHRLILLGAVPAALLALFCDRLISFIESTIRRKQFPFKWLSAFTGVMFVMLFGCVIVGGTKVCTSEIANDVIRIASKNFSEQFILSEIMAQLIEAKTNLKVQRKLNLGTTDIVHQAMLRGEVDLYPEYTGTAYLTVLHFQLNHSATDFFKIVKTSYDKKFNLAWLPPFGFNNANALLVTKAFADQNQLRTISDLSRLTNPVTIGAPPEFIKREDGYRGLLKTYGLHFSRVIQMDPALLYQSIVNNDVRVIAGFTTDGQIPAYQLTALTDDRQFYPPYQAAPVIRKAMLQQHPELQPILAMLAGRMTDEVMQALNARATIQHQSPQQIAHDFLITQKLI